MLILKELNEEDSKKEYQFFQEMQSENGFEVPYKNISYEQFVEKGIKERMESSKGINLKEGMVPDTYFFLWKDSEIVGLFKIRHYLNDFLRKGSGHIGYGIHKKHRKKGYATKGLALAIEECKKRMPIEEKEIYTSCNLDNIASFHVLMKNKAYLHHSDETVHHLRIKVQKK